MDNYVDVTPDRKGEWMCLSTGRRFWPQDPRPEDVHLDDIAVGLANDCRYAGQLKAGQYYSVAEHSVLMTRYADEELGWSADALLCVLLDDAAEAYLNDVVVAVKRALGEAYSTLEGRVQEAILSRFGVSELHQLLKPDIKELDRRIVPVEKAAVMNAAHQRWALDALPPLPGVQVMGWLPSAATIHFQYTARKLIRRMRSLGYNIEA